MPLPTLIECNHMAEDRTEIPTPDVARHHPHLKTIADHIPPLDEDAQILLLLGRDIMRAHKIREQRNGDHNGPSAQRLDLGWVVVGEVCIDRIRGPDNVGALQTNLLENGRISHFKSCPNHFQVHEKLETKRNYGDAPVARKYPNDLGSTVFQTTKDDDKQAPSMEDKEFLRLMDKELFKDELGSWVAPLPFRSPRRRLPNNRDHAMSRLASLRRNLQRKPETKEHFVAFMQKIFHSGHAESAPPLKEGEECWYLPSFGVYHPQKPGQIRVVFDSSAQHQGVSLNDVLLTGPDLTNSLLGVLIRFRKEPIAVTADIQQMFHCFLVREDNRNYLRFLWYQDDDVEKEITEYRMKVHVFGNSPSPAVAAYGLRRTAQDGEAEFGKDARSFVERDFYVDDGLKSVPTEEEAVDLLKRTQKMLAKANLRLHKIASNSATVMKAFHADDQAPDLKNLDLGTDTPPIQRSLGISWNLKTDTFTFQVAIEEKPFTRRGVLSTVNSLYDPLGFVAPVTIQGKSLLREMSFEKQEWDTPLPPEKRKEWETWKHSLKALEQLQIPRPYSPISLTAAHSKELCVFSDASTKAIAAVAYLKTTDVDGSCHIRFILGKAKLAPQPDHTIPRLELCGAVLAVELAELIENEMDSKPDAVKLYTDSKVVLGYIYNKKRRFYVYVANRVERIRKSTQPEQWHHVPTEQNPADHATRSVPASQLQNTSWLTGPTFLAQPAETLPTPVDDFELVDPEKDTEIRPPQVSVVLTNVSHKNAFGSHRFQRFSKWTALLRTVAHLGHIASSFRQTPDGKTTGCHGWHICKELRTVEEITKAKKTVLSHVQRETYAEEINCIRGKKSVNKNSPLWKLNPFIDNDGLMRVGGRLNKSQLSREESNPLIIPGRHHIATLLVRHYHEQVMHQGRHFTEGAIRAAGIWVVGMKRCVASNLHKCVRCRMLRGKSQDQRMADLPVDRLNTEPPFTYVGLDVFGPWMVISRRTRGGLANSKRWAVLFTCMSMRAIHIEVIESMDASSFINALRRFFAVRGPVKQIRSDCGTNFVGACKELQIDTKDNRDNSIKRYLRDQECTWTFNPPHSSHMGGAWERMIGVVRRILDSMMLKSNLTRLTHEVLTTFMAEISAIINARPLIPVSTDPESPSILTPAMLLTQKVGNIPTPVEGFNSKDMYKRQWRQVQHLANTFWDRWRREYLVTLQERHKWQTVKPDIQVGDVVLLKDKQVTRNEWPMGLIIKTFPSEDERVRKVEVRVTQNGVVKTFLRPITETILLMPKSDYHKEELATSSMDSERHCGASS
ncbi:uncharacterized protein LOC142481354 [Ascaphus truei]|uniref:uncharacterized protein LOC142481354 n=1 Tax=Ascaphus truei TaxID=8439 RepID=UPI003F5AC53B